MKPNLLQRFFFFIILVIVLLPAASAFGGLPGPTPPAPPPIPTPPPDTGFDYVKVDDARGQTGITTQTEIGTSGKDKIVMYGGKDNITQYTSGLEGNDWLLQVGGEKTNTQTISGGGGDDTIYQYGGQGDSIQSGTGGVGNDTIIQVGGQGDNSMTNYGGDGNDYQEMYGGAGNNTINVDGGAGDDVLRIYGGPRNNSITYGQSSGNDVVTILGGGVYNTLKINVGAYKNITLKDYQGRVLYQYGNYPDPPSAAPTAVLSATAGSVTAGQHWVRITFVTAGGESGSSPASAAVLADGSHTIDVSQIPLGPAGTTARKIYLTKVGDIDGVNGNYFLAGTLSDNTSTTFAITVPDSSLGPGAPGATTMTVANLHQIKVIDPGGNTIWQYSSGATSAIVPLLLGN
ncbi:MAG: hypothetical protein ACYDIC_20200 [Desulfobaccales bacterium]